MIKACFLTNIGKVRTNNEDSLMFNDLVVSETNMNEPVTLLLDSDKALVAVADGMGGHEKGDLASRTTLHFLREKFRDVTSPGDVLHLVKGALDALNELVRTENGNRGMGTTVAGLLFTGTSMIVFNCGDSRVYRLNGKFLERITQDHTIVQNLVDTGEITEDEARIHPRKNVLTSAIIGDLKDDMPEVFVKEIPIIDKQRFLLCSDGLWESMSIEELEECFDHEDLPGIVKALFSKVMHGEAGDNLSIILVEGQQHEQL